MKTAINAAFLRSLPVPECGHTDVRDTKVRGLVLRVRASGRHAYYFNYKRGRWLKLGAAKTIAPHVARELAANAATTVARGKDPQVEKAKARASTLRKFVEGIFAEWARSHQRRGAATVERLQTHFVSRWGGLPLDEITHVRVEQWRSERRSAGVAASTLNRDVGALKAALQRAVEWRLLEANPLERLKPFRIDGRGVVRYLSESEEDTLRAALAARDETRRREREHANTWRRERGYEGWPLLGTYTDHLTPLVLLALNTGARRGELLGLLWTDVNLDRALLTVRGSGSKNAQTRHVPLNSEAVEVLETWKDLGEAHGWVFPSPTDSGHPLEGIKTAWLALVRDAKIKNFRFHDCRHHFASRLVQAGVDLNTVRELLGHADIKMVLRYAHLAPENTAAAVAKLVRPSPCAADSDDRKVA